MAESSTVARPYAQAIFELARDDGAFQRWSDVLQMLVSIVRDPTLLALIHSPRVSDEELAALIVDIGGEHLDDSGANVVRLLAANDRLPLLPEIAALYERLRAEAQGVVDAELVSAAPVSDAQRERVREALERRFGASVNLQCRTDEALMGGALVRAGDWVIDGSVRAQLRKLAGALGA